MTNREKYDRFRALYTDSDPHRQDHRRFDALVRLLLDLPEKDVPMLKEGDFVRWKMHDMPLRVVRATAFHVDCIDHREHRYSALSVRDVEPLSAWNAEVLPF